MTQLYTGGAPGVSVTGSFGGTMSTVAPGGSPGSKRKFPPAPGFLSNEERHLNKLNTTAQITPGTLSLNQSLGPGSYGQLQDYSSKYEKTLEEGSSYFIKDNGHFN